MLHYAETKYYTTMTQIHRYLFKIFGLMWAANLVASPVIPLTVGQLAKESDLIVHGEVIGKSVQRDPEGRIYTRVELDLTEVWKGDVKTQPLVIVHSGGILGNRWAATQDEVSFKMGEEVVVFLVLNSRGEGVTMGMNQGKFLISSDKSSGWKYAQNPFHGGLPTAPDKKPGYRLPTQIPLTVEGLKAQVARHNS